MLSQGKTLKTLGEAIRIVFSERVSFLYLCCGMLVFGFIYVYIPVFITPGNSLAFFLEITPWWAILLLLLLSILMGILTAMQFYIWRTMRKARAHEIGLGLGAVLSSFLSGIFSSATCAACISALFSFFIPPVGILVLLSYRWWIIATGAILVLFSIRLTSKRVVHGCAQCNTQMTKK